MDHVLPPAAAREPRHSPPIDAAASAHEEPLYATAVIRTLPGAAESEGRPLPSWRTVVSLFAALVSTLALVAARADAQASFQPSSIDRGMVVESLQELSDYVGFEGHFALGADDRTLVMTGSDLCGDDFPRVVPPAFWRRVVEAGFESFECSAAGVQVRLAVRPEPAVSPGAPDRD